MVWFALIMFVVGALAMWAILDAIYIAPLRAQIQEMDLQNLKRELRAEADLHRRRAYIRRQHLGTPYINREQRTVQFRYPDDFPAGVKSGDRLVADVDFSDHSKSAELRVIQ